MTTCQIYNKSPTLSGTNFGKKIKKSFKKQFVEWAVVYDLMENLNQGSTLHTAQGNDEANLLNPKRTRFLKRKPNKNNHIWSMNSKKN